MMLARLYANQVGDQWSRRVERSLTVAALVLLALSCGACGGSVYARHATAAASAKTLLNGAADSIETACDVRTVTMSQDPQGRAAVCLRAGEAHATAVSAWVTWVTAVLVAADDDSAIESALTMARPIVLFLLDMRDLLVGSGVELPEIPPLLLGLVGADQ